MKKGFTMIELIFVIVILGILASVAIPRLAATREDAEISAAVANLRTLVSDATAYYTVKGDFGTNTNAAKWSAITSVPLLTKDGAAIGDTATTTEAYLKVGDAKDCIKFELKNKATTADGTSVTTPAHIKFTKKSSNAGNVCSEVLKSAPVTAYLDSKVTKSNGQTESNAIVVGSSTSVYGSK